MQELCNIDIRLLELFNGSDFGFIDTLAVTLTSGVLWIPLYVSLLYVVIRNNDTMSQIVLSVGCALLCVMITACVGELVVKPLAGRMRPCNDPLVKLGIDVVRGVCPKSFSFFSSHAANTFGLAVFFSCLVRSRMLTIALVSWSLVNCWTRLYLGVHYPSDVVCGLLFGCFTGIFAYFLYRRLCMRMSVRTSSDSGQGYTSSGYAVTDVDIIINVLTFTLCFGVIRALIQ